MSRASLVALAMGGMRSRRYGRIVNLSSIAARPPRSLGSYPERAVTNAQHDLALSPPILDYWAEHEETLGAIITHVLVHEIGHHFGLSDDDMRAIEASAA